MMMFPLQRTKLNEFSSVNKPQHNTQNRPQSDWLECLRRSKGETFFLNISKVVHVAVSQAALTPHRPSTSLHVTSCTFPAISPACDESGWRKVLVLSVPFLLCLTIKFQRQISCWWHHMKALTSFESAQEFVFLFTHVILSTWLRVCGGWDGREGKDCRSHPYVKLFISQIWM